MHILDDRSALVGPRQPSDRASEFRSILSARQEADAILADATEVRRNAGLQAELLVAEAEALSSDLTDQAMSVHDQAIGEARERADGILAAARAQIVTDREAFRAEMDSLRREQVSSGRPDDDVLADIDHTLRTLAATLQRARESVTAAEGTIGLLRAEMAGGGDPLAPRTASRPRTAPAPEVTTAPTGAPHGDEQPEESTEPRPLGWLFRPDRA